MRPSAGQIEWIAERLVKRLAEAGLMELEAAATQVRDEFVVILTRNFDEEAAIDREAAAEAEKLVRQGAPGIRRDELDLRKVEQLVRQRLAKARGFPL